MSEQLQADVDWGASFKDHYDQFDHPLNPELKVKDFGMAVELATATKAGGTGPEDAHASPHEAGLFWKEFSSLEPPLSPQKYLETMKSLSYLSWRYHQRAPLMSEISLHRDSDPQKIRSHYENLPATHWGYPDVSAGDFVKVHTRASYWSQQHLSRPPYAHEVAYFAHSSHSADQIGEHYDGLRQNRAANPPAQAPEQGGQKPSSPLHEQAGQQQ